MTPRHRLRTRIAAASLVALATVAAACSGGSGGSDAGSAGSSADLATEEVPAAGRRAAAESEAGGSLDSSVGGLADGTAAEPAAAVPAADRKVISTGNVALRADDVEDARFEVQKVVDRYGGEVAEEKTATDDDGEIAHSRLVLRVPSADFDDAVDSLEEAAELVEASTTSEDVTTKVLDVDIRVRVQRRSIRRIELLLDRAQSIRDIVSIEAQLSQRQAALASLEQQQDYLADQTSMSTITVSLERAPDERAGADDAGFLSGLSAGWSGLVTTALAAVTVVGALLPFVALAVLVAVPAWPLLKRLRSRRRPAPSRPAPSPPA